MKSKKKCDIPLFDAEFHRHSNTTKNKYFFEVRRFNQPVFYFVNYEFLKNVNWKFDFAIILYGRIKLIYLEFKFYRIVKKSLLVDFREARTE